MSTIYKVQQRKGLQTNRKVSRRPKRARHRKEAPVNNKAKAPFVATDSEQDQAGCRWSHPAGTDRSRGLPPGQSIASALLAGG